MYFSIFDRNLAQKRIITFFLGFSILSFFPIYHAFKGQNQSKLTLFNPIVNDDRAAESVKQIAADGSTIAQAIKESLNTKFEELFIQLQQEFPFTQGAWRQALTELEGLKKNDKLLVKNPIIKHKKNDIPLVKKARQLLASYNIDPSRVNIITMNDQDNASYAFAVQSCFKNKIEHFLRLNLAQLPHQTPAVQEALLRHEIMHLLNYDPLTCAFIEELFKDHGITPKEFWANDIFTDFNKHMEYRADLMASLNDIATAQALMEGFVKHMSRYDDTIDSRTHPSCKERYLALKNLTQYMHAENHLKMV